MKQSSLTDLIRQEEVYSKKQSGIDPEGGLSANVSSTKNTAVVYGQI